MEERQRCVHDGRTIDRLEAAMGIIYVHGIHHLHYLRHLIFPCCATLPATHRTESTPLLAKGDAQGTVGAVAIDMNGKLAAASSTGGMCNKRPGRVGDTPLIGCGLYANARLAVAATGRGEAFIHRAGAARIAFAMEFGGMDLQAAVRNAMADMDEGSGGFIAVDASGRIVMEYNTGGMFRAAWAAGDVEPTVMIWKDEPS